MTSRRELLNPEQSAAIEQMLAWFESDSKYFLLRGYAGTGKTFTARAFADEVRGRLVFTAPTNKAVKVLRQSLTDEKYKPECRTIFSLLGLRLEANGEVKELSAPEDPIDLTQYAAVIVDEGSMVNEAVMQHIRYAADSTGVKFLFMGDSAQLPPVGEKASAIWAIDDGAKLETVMRHDNQILALATAIRKVVDHPAPRVGMKADHDDHEGVWYVSAAEFESRFRDEALAGRCLLPTQVKAIAWRNVRVDTLNRLARSALFTDPSVPWYPTDRVVFTAPAKDLDDNTVATTDDEGAIVRAVEDYHPVYGEFPIWRLTIDIDGGQTVAARVLHQDGVRAFNVKVEALAAAAKADRRKWRYFWDFKDAFHQVRHAYAITAHRSQGSTYEAAYVDWRDILLNQNRQEAYRCLYVACSRPKKRLILG